MAWGEVRIMDQKISFINEWKEKKYTFAEVCRRFEISRKTGYKWIDRYQKDNINGLKNLSRAPKSQALETNPVLVNKILDLKHFRSTWGPKKILAELQKHNSLLDWPSATTIGNILDRNGLVVRRKNRKRFPKNIFTYF